MWNCPSSANELAMFFDHFLNGANNGWEKTPRVRTTILRFTDDPIFDVEEEDYPIPRTEYRKAFLSPGNKLTFSAPPNNEIISYNSERCLNCAPVTYIFEKKTRLAGLPKAVLYVFTLEAKDMDIYVRLRKLDSKGNAVVNLNIP